MSWYLRSTDDHDTHRGTMNRGSVIAVCGIRFAPRTVAFGRIDERRYHPVGVYKAECSHLLMMVVQLHEQPYGKACEACAGQQFARAVSKLTRNYGARTELWHRHITVPSRRRERWHSDMAKQAAATSRADRNPLAVDLRLVAHPRCGGDRGRHLAADRLAVRHRW